MLFNFPRGSNNNILILGTFFPSHGTYHRELGDFFLKGLFKFDKKDPDESRWRFCRDFFSTLNWKNGKTRFTSSVNK